MVISPGRLDASRSEALSVSLLWDLDMEWHSYITGLELSRGKGEELCWSVCGTGYVGLCIAQAMLICPFNLGNASPR